VYRRGQPASRSGYNAWSWPSWWVRRAPRAAAVAESAGRSTATKYLPASS